MLAGSKSIQEDDLDIDFRHYGDGFDIEFEDLSRNLNHAIRSGKSR